MTEPTLGEWKCQICGKCGIGLKDAVAHYEEHPEVQA